MNVLRTPDERFADLPGFAYGPRYVEVDGLRIHYVDEGAGPAVLLMHGEPTWAYLYRKMIPVLVDAGFRAIAPDLVGFGRSDKPTEREDYTYQRHIDWMLGAIRQIDPKDVTFFGQDWGGLVGLRLVSAEPGRYARVVVSNTGLPLGDGRVGKAFMNWREFSQTTPEFPIGALVSGGCATAKLTPEEIAAYDAPFPDDSYKEGARQFPVLVPISADDPIVPSQREAWRVFDAWDKPFLTAFGDSDPLTGGGDRIFQERVPGAKGQHHTTIAGGGHFIQEDKGEELARVIADFIAAT
ncbi:MAG: haloalkane dehalogenase [Actinomycetota bacterium]